MHTVIKMYTYFNKAPKKIAVAMFVNHEVTMMTSIKLSQEQTVLSSISQVNKTEC